MTFKVDTRGIPELVAAFSEITGKIDPAIGKSLTAAAEPIKADVRRRAGPYSERTAGGVRIRRRGTMVRVEQGMRKTTGAHSNYGGFQQRNFFDPALNDNKDEVVALLLAVVDAIADKASES